MIGELLGYAKQHPTGVIVGLLIIMAAGGVAGGTWIQNLRSMIEERDKLLVERDKATAERQQLIRDRQQQELRELEQAIALLRVQAGIIERAAEAIAGRLHELASIVGGLNSKGTVTAATAAKLDLAVQGATRDAQSLAEALQRTRDVGRVLEILRPSPQKSPPAPSSGAYDSTNFIVVYVLFAAFMLLLIRLVALLRRAWNAVVSASRIVTPAEVRTARGALGLTQEQLAEALDVHRATVASWEIGPEPIPRIAALAIEALSKRGNRMNIAWRRRGGSSGEA